MNGGVLSLTPPPGITRRPFFGRSGAGALQAVLALFALRTHEHDASGAEPQAVDRFKTLILPHLDAAHNLARFLSGDAVAAEDIVQDAFLRAFRAFDDFRGRSGRAWILAIVRNCHNDWRAACRRDAVLEPLETEPGDTAIAGENTDFREHPGLPKEEMTPEQLLSQRMEAREVRRVLAALPELFREILVLRELEDLSYREIAEVTATPIGTVMSRLARARALFAAAWMKQALGKAPS